MQLEDIKRRRKNLGMTQAELAELSKVSQSMITKIEAGKLVPAYDKARAIFNALDKVGQKIGKKASDLMTRSVVIVDYDDAIDKATKLMRKKQLSNLPVMNDGKVVGTISEKIIVDNLSRKDLGKCKVHEIMSDAPPTISENSPVQMVSDLLRYNSLLVVVKDAKVIGVITKSDLLDLVTS